jgi:hypothetical protein
MDRSLFRAEFLNDHRVHARMNLVDLLPKQAVGAEVGVFTGLFSTLLLKATRPKKIHFVDPWRKEYGSRYPDWGLYTDNEKLSATLAYEVASPALQWAIRAL